MTSLESPAKQAIETLLSVQETLVETINLLDIRADQLVESQTFLTEQRALLNTVKGLKSLVELQIHTSGSIK